MPYEKECDNNNCIYYDEDFDCNCSGGYQDGEDYCPGDN